MNPQPADSDAIDRQFCWQQVLRVQPWFRLSYPYASRELTSSLLTIYALFSALEEAHFRVSDESISEVKLAWWQQQLFGTESSTSNHPITRQLHRCGLIQRPSLEHLQGLLETSIKRLAAPAPTDEQSLKSLCVLIGRYPMRLELALQDECPAENAALESACAAIGLVQLMRESCRSEIPGYGWVPLNLLARHDLTRSELHLGSKPEMARQLLRQLCDLGLSWTGMEGRSGRTSGLLLNSDADWLRRHRHWVIQAELHNRLLQKLQNSKVGLKGRLFSRTFPGDVWFAWRTARRSAWD